MADTYQPSDEQAEALWAATGVVNLPEARRFTDAELGHAVAEGAAFQAIIRAAQAQALRSLANEALFETVGMERSVQIHDWIKAQANRIESADV